MRLSHVRWCGMGFLAAVMLLVLGLATNAAAQAQSGGTGQVVGTTYDSTGALVPQAKVTLSSKATGLTREESSDDEGLFRFILVPIGFYTVSFNKAGFKTYKVDVEVTVGAAITVNARLEVGEVSQVVEVTASALIESTQPNPDALIGVRPIQELPINGRRFQDFVTLTPTVQIEPQRNGISFAGQRGINGNVTIDGADYNEPFFGGIRGGERSNNAFTIPQEAISQFQVVAYGYSVEFGRSSGGILNATTKSGTNDIHGSVFFFARDGALAKKDAFGRDAITTLYQEGASLGGHLIRDKAFFFMAFERQTNDNPRVVVFHSLDPSNFPSGPSPSQLEAACFYRGTFTGCPAGSGQEQPFTQTNDAITGFGRLDWQPSTNHRFSASYHYSKNTGLNAVSTGDAISPETNRAQSNNGTEGDRTNTVVGSWTAIFSPRVVLETRGQYSLENRPRLSNSTLTGISTSIGTTGARNFLPTTLDDWRAAGSANLTWTSGRHSLKFGGEYNFLHANQSFFFNQFGVFNFFSSTSNILQFLSDNHLTGGNNRFDTPLATYVVNIGNGLLTANMKQVAAFIQDTWRMTRQFTLTAGFRWEGYVNPQPDTSNTALYNQVKNFPFPLGITNDPARIPNNYRQYMPRAGIAWDPKGNGKTVIRANAGLFYAPTPLIVLAAPLNNYRTPAGDLSVQLPLALPAGFVCVPQFAGDNCNTVYSQLRRIGIDLNTFTLNNLPKITPAQIQQLATALGLANPNPSLSSSPISMTNDYESPRAFEWNVGMEQELSKGWSVGADYAYINTVHLERDRNLNLPPPVTCTALGAVAGTNAFCNVVDLSLRPCFGVVRGGICSGSASGATARLRPISNLGDITIRATDGRSRYNAFTLRTNLHRGRFLLQGYYTLSYNYSNDDNERLASGFDHDNEFNLKPEYNFSRLDARHLFQYNALVDLPWGFTISSLGRFRSGRPLEPLTGTDTLIRCTATTPPPCGTIIPVGGIFAEGNSDNNSFSDRPFQAPGVTFLRNSFRDRRTLNVDMRVAKKFKLPRESMHLDITADFFNLFNFNNVVFVGGTPSTGNATEVFGAGVNPATGLALPPNQAFQQLKAPQFCLPNAGGNASCYNTRNTPGPPFTMQLGIRFQF